MKKILLLSLLFPLISCAMDNDMKAACFKGTEKKIAITSILEDKQKTPTERMELIHGKILVYLKEGIGKSGHRLVDGGTSSFVNDYACDELLKENPQADLSAYRSNGQKFIEMSHALLKCTMGEEGMSLVEIAEKVGIVSAIKDKRGMNYVHHKLQNYIQKQLDQGYRVSLDQIMNGTAAQLNDYACDEFSKENPEVDLSAYRSNGRLYKEIEKGIY